jgi:signal transduction histidine kinase
MLLLTFRASVRPPSPEQVVRGGTAAEGTPTVAADTSAAVPAVPAVPAEGVGVRIEVEWASFIPSVLLHVVTFLVVLYGARALVRSLERRSASTTLLSRWMLTLGTLGGLGVGLFAVLRLVHLLPGFSRLAPISIGAVLGYVAPILLVTAAASLIDGTEIALSSARAAKARTNDDLARAVARVNSLLTHERRVFARRLHASVQAAVNAGSLLLQRSLTDPAAGASDAADDVVDRVGSMIERALLDLDRVDDDAPDLETRLAAIVDTWDELCDIELDVDDEVLLRLATDPVAAATLGDLVAEACANAVVHGGAGSVQVTVRLEENDRARLRVDDDGEATHPMRNDGLGTRTLEAHCTAWTLTHHETGTTLDAALPIR